VSFPTVLGPWFVVVRETTYDDDVILGQEFYTAIDGGASKTFQTDPKIAMLFMSLHAAARVAAAEVAWVRVLTSKEDAEEFGRT
jgi:hypothetical protein